MNNYYRDELEQVVALVRANPKYEALEAAFVREVAAKELLKRRSVKETVKATRNKLHQVAGVYQAGKEDYAGWLDDLRAAYQAGDASALRAVCLRIMSSHASTRERIPILGQFYSTLLAEAPPPRTVLDIACGLNPLAIPWMRLPSDVEYYAYDVYEDMCDFLNGFLEIIRVDGKAETLDVIQSPPTQKADLAFILKAIPCLEQVDKSAGSRLLEAVNAERLIVSFPVHSLGGRSKGMAANYEARFHELVAGKGWRVKKFEFTTELAFVVSK